MAGPRPEDPAAPLPSAAETERRWQALHRRFALELGDALRVREGGAPLHVAPLDERLIQAVWSDQMVRAAELTTASGKAVEVLEPGRWNTARGPDFLDARLRIAGEVVEGDVEVHLDSAGWRQHAHHQDFAYNRVILHVTLDASDDRPFEEKQNGERLERLVLRSFLEPDLETIRATLNPSDYPYGKPEDLGLCHTQFLRLPEDELREFLQVAGRSRIEQKVARLAAQRATARPEQLFHQALLTAQGFKSSKTLYFLLSKRTPVTELLDLARDVPAADRTDFLLSVFLHVARLMPEQEELRTVQDPAAAAFVARLQRLWAGARPYLSDRLMPPTRRWFAGMRPAGFPTRRLAASAFLLQRVLDPQRPLLPQLHARLRATRLRDLKPRELSAWWRETFALFVVEEEQHFFSTHFTFGGKAQPPQALLGEPAAASLVFNVALPLTLLEARERGDGGLEAAAWQALHAFPALEKNSVVRFMEHRLLGDSSGAAAWLRRELYQQAFMKVFADCCAQNERTCDDCTFLALAERERASGAPP